MDGAPEMEGASRERWSGRAFEDGEREGNELEKEVVELVFVAEVGPELGADGGDRGGVDAGGSFGQMRGHVAASAHGTCAAGGGVLGVEEGVGHGVDELMGEDARDGVSTAMQRMVPSAMPARTSRRPSRSMASVRVSFMTSRTSGWSGISMSPVMVSGQAEAWGKTLAKRFVGAGALDLGGHALALLHAQELEAAAGGPAPAVLEEGRGDRGLLEELAGGEGGEEVEDVGEREAVLLGQGDVDAVVGGGGL